MGQKRVYREDRGYTRSRTPVRRAAAGSSAPSRTPARRTAAGSSASARTPVRRTGTGSSAPYRAAVSARSADRGYGRTGSSARMATRQAYVYGSAALAPQPQEVPAVRQKAAAPAPVRQTRSEAQKKRSQDAVLRNREKAGRMNAALIVFMTMVLCVMAFGLVHFINLRASVTYSVKEISRLESELATLRESNAETLGQINASINLEEVKYRAIADLGMTYADEGQIVNYSAGTDDYVHQSKQLDD